MKAQYREIPCEVLAEQRRAYYKRQARIESAKFAASVICGIVAFYGFIVIGLSADVLFF